MDKKQLRREIGAKKKQLTAAQIDDCSLRLARRLREDPAYRAARSIYLYLSYNQEVRTEPVLRAALADGKRVAVPKVFGREMRFLWLDDPDAVAPGAYGIPEPVADGPEADDDRALILMPGLAFDREGHRCGYGGGFYDQWLAAHPGHPTVALCYDFQLLPHVDTDAHDIPVDRVIAEPVEQPASNYERLCLQWAEKVRAMDFAILRRRLPELQPLSGGYRIVHFGRAYRIDAGSGVITAEDGGPATRTQRLNIYTLLGYCRDDAVITGRWVPFREVPGAAPFAPAFDRTVLKPLAATFSGHLPELRRAAEALGAAPLQSGDAGFQLEAFACIPLQYLFWDGDDEFPAQANVLFDSGVTGFIHEESTVTLASEGFRRLAEAAGLPMLGGGYDV